MEDVVGSVMLALILAVSQAFDAMQGFHFIAAVGIWIIAILPVWLMDAIPIRWILQTTKQSYLLGFMLSMAVVLIASIPQTLYIQVFFKFVGDEVASFELIFIRVLAISLSTTIFVYVLTVGKVNLNNQARTPKHVLDTSNAKFLTDNLPSEIGINILSMHAEDHYLRIVTDKGEALILMRLRDAIASMGEDAGIQTHRSHWVSATSTPVMIKQNGKPALELRDGRTVPVSRHYLRAVRHHCDAR